MASDSDINLLTVVGRINLKYVRDIKNTTIINKLNQYLDIHAGLNINKQRQSDFCKLQYVLSSGKSHGMESCKQMGRSNFYKQRDLEQIRNLLEKDVDIKEVTVLVKSIDEKLVTNGSYVIIANLPHGVKSSNKGFLNTGKILLIKYGDNSGVEWYTIYNNKDSNDKTAISLEKQAKYILQNDTYILSDEDNKKKGQVVATNKIKPAAALPDLPAPPAVQPQAAAALPAAALPAAALPAPAPPAVQPQAAPALPAPAVQPQAAPALPAPPPAVQPQAAPAPPAVQPQASRVQTLVTKKNTTSALLELKDRLPQRSAMQRIRHANSVINNKLKEGVIEDVNTEISKYNKVFPDSLIKQIDYKDKDIDKINRADIIAQILDKIKEINDQLGGKSTRRRRRKMNPTRKIGHKKPKTKKKSNKGVINKRKTRSKK
jgi:hypothetical protein